MKSKHRFIGNARSIIAASLATASLLSLGVTTQAAHPGGSSSTPTYEAANVINADTNVSKQTYVSSTAPQNALLVTGGSSILTDASVTKTGSPSGRSDDYDFYGTNAAVLAKDNGELTLKGGSVTTDGSYANAVYAYGSGQIHVDGTTITTSSNNSGGVMVTGGGSLDANNATVTTSGNSAAAIRSDKGGGELVVSGGSYTTDGTGSPVIYSTADISVKDDAILMANHSEGVVVEGGNSVSLDGVTLTAHNDTHNGKSETYKGIFIYQSMSGDAKSGTSSFQAKNSSITNEVGDVFFITNTTCTIDLEENTIVNEDADGGFLRAQAGAWGNSGSNGGNVTLNLSGQDAEGDIYVDSVSTLSMTMEDGSNYTGAINADNSGKSVTVTLDAGSTWTLTGDSYVSSITNADKNNSNINLNGYTLNVGQQATQTDTNDADVNNIDNNDSSKNKQQAPGKPGDSVSENNVAGKDSNESAQQPPEKPGNNTNGSSKFSDVDGDAYYASAVDWAVGHEITSGTGNNQFSPKKSCTRAEMVTFLWREAGQPNAQTRPDNFSDVDADAYYAPAVAWAVENGITNGISKDSFNPNGTLDRAQAVTFLHRMSKETNSTQQNSVFKDIDRNAYYASAVDWAVEKNITNGVGEDRFAPTDIVDRAQVVTFMHRTFGSDQNNGPSNSQLPPEMPNGEAPDGQQPPEMPNGEMPNGQQPSEKPSSEAPDGQQPPEKPNGEAPDGQQPPDIPNGEAPDGQRPSEIPNMEALNGQLPPEKPNSETSN